IVHFAEADSGTTISWVVDINDKRRRPAHRERWAQTVRELTIGDQHLRLTVVKHEGDGLRIEPHVDRVEHGATHRYTELTFEHLWRIPQHRGHRIAATDATLREGRGEPAAAGVGLGPGEAAVHIEQRCPLRTGRGTPIEE